MYAMQIARWLIGYHGKTVFEQKSILERIYRTGGMEALQYAAKKVKITVSHACCLAGAKDSRMRKNRRSRVKWCNERKLTQEITDAARRAAGGGKIVETGGKVVSTKISNSRGQVRSMAKSQAWEALR
ncbi:MAG: hypothetical protein A4E56_01895 [Pelotomaculum sp. PtaU1.Bin065]|nr:MAG: hypothetical protein A4E56_01895 [Pelotomaculum sp. PtaU1.Bin065]